MWYSLPYKHEKACWQQKCKDTGQRALSLQSRLRLPAFKIEQCVASAALNVHPEGPMSHYQHIVARRPSFMFVSPNDDHDTHGIRYT